MPRYSSSKQTTCLIVTPTQVQITLKSAAQLNLPSNYVCVLDDVTLMVKDSGSAGDIVLYLIDTVDTNYLFTLGKTFSAGELDTLSKSFPRGMPLLPIAPAAGQGHGLQINPAAYTFQFNISGNVDPTALQFLSVTYHYEAPSELR